MGTTTESTVQGNVLLITKNRDEIPGLEANLMRFSVVMSFADKLLERKVLTPKEYADFSVETAQECALNMLQNPCFLTR